MSVEKQRRLGRGLEALIGSAQTANASASELQRIPTSRIRPNPYQPRREFDPGASAFKPTVQDERASSTDHGASQGR